jgi:hypothetical protein
MTEYLIAFNDEWVPDHTVEELREKSRALRPLIAEMKAAGVLIFTGGLADAAARLWAGKIAVACGWPQEVRRFRVPMQLPETSQRSRRACREAGAKASPEASWRRRLLMVGGWSCAGRVLGRHSLSQRPARQWRLRSPT